MELPRRERGDELLPAGEMTAIRSRLRRMTAGKDLTTVIACAFDHRTRMLPFIYADKRMAPAGVREIGSSLADSGFERTRIVLRQWNRHFQPSKMQLDGRVPDLFLVSSMQLHTAPMKALIRDACRIDPDKRPLILAGGPKIIYEPWDAFSADRDDPWAADAAVTGETYILLNLLEVLLSIHSPGQSLRASFQRAKNGGMLDEVPGLVYSRGDRDGVPEELVDTGIQRLVPDLDELPDPVLGYSMLEPPSRKATLSPRPMPPEKIRWRSPISTLILTFGCKFGCPYCPIPAYNQRQLRAKSGERIAWEMTRLYKTYGLKNFFGADDNFFANRDRAVDIMQTLTDTEIDGKRLRRRVCWSTEVTVHDVVQMRDKLPLARRAGMWAVWVGIEDMTGTLVSKGQNVDTTLQAIRSLRANRIYVNPMMMHHDPQPLLTRGSAYGLLNQVDLLRREGVISMQVLMITPASGSKLYEEVFSTALAYDKVAGKQVEYHMLDANYVVASHHPQPWKKQLNILASYLYFYNPIRFFISLVAPKGTKLYLADAYFQVLGMWGLTRTVPRTLAWAFRLMTGRIRRRTKPLVSKIPMRDVDGGKAAHAIPGTPLSQVRTEGEYVPEHEAARQTVSRR